MYYQQLKRDRKRPEWPPAGLPRQALGYTSGYTSGILRGILLDHRGWPLGGSGRGASKCLWIPPDASGCLWVPLGAIGCIWVPRVPLRAPRCCLRVPLGASGCPWVLGAFGSLWAPLGAKSKERSTNINNFNEYQQI